MSRADTETAVDRLYRSDWGRIVAALIRLLGDFEVAEEAAQDAFTAAIEQWADAGVPEYPRAWIIQTARHKAVDRIRRQARFHEKLREIAATPSMAAVFTPAGSESLPEHDEIPDGRLRLIFTCCHPALRQDAQIA